MHGVVAPMQLCCIDDIYLDISSVTMVSLLTTPIKNKAKLFYMF
jgi:hypothetical protein